MFRLPYFFVLLAWLMAATTTTTTAFAPQPQRTCRPAKLVQGARTMTAAGVWLKMAADDQDAQNKISADGTFYDDEVSFVVLVVLLFVVLFVLFGWTYHPRILLPTQSVW